MRSTLLAAAVAVATLTAPAAARPIGWGVVTVGHGDITSNGTGNDPTFHTSASCSYTGQTLSLHAAAYRPTAGSVSVDATCTMYFGVTAYGVMANDSESNALQAVGNGMNQSVPLSLTAPRALCLSLTAWWGGGGGFFSHYRCVTPGAYGWFDTMEIAVPLDQS